MVKLKLLAVSTLLILLFGCGENTANTAKTPDQTAGQVTTGTETPAVVTTPADSGTTSAVTTAKEYALSELTGHSTAADCWMAIDGKVYDVSKYIAKHPGGEAILNGCGTDGSMMFAGVPHSDRARKLLENYYLGDLQK